MTGSFRTALVALVASLLLRVPAFAGTGDTSWMLKAKYGIFLHYHGQGDANQFSDRELIDWINTCNRQGGVCTLDWPFDPDTGLLKDFGIAQLKRIAHAVKGPSQSPRSP